MLVKALKIGRVWTHIALQRPYALSSRFRQFATSSLVSSRLLLAVVFIDMSLVARATSCAVCIVTPARSLPTALVSNPACAGPPGGGQTMCSNNVSKSMNIALMSMFLSFMAFILIFSRAAMPRGPPLTLPPPLTTKALDMCDSMPLSVNRCDWCGCELVGRMFIECSSLP